MNVSSSKNPLPTANLPLTVKRRSANQPKKKPGPSLILVRLLLAAFVLFACATFAETTNQSTVEDGRFIFEARLKGTPGEQTKTIFATALHHSMRASVDKLSHTIRLHVDVIQGSPGELSLFLTGAGEVRQVTGDGLLDWSVRKEPGGKRFLILRLKKRATPVTNFLATVMADTALDELPDTVTPLGIASTQPALSHGYLRIDAEPGVSVRAEELQGMITAAFEELPADLRAAPTNTVEEPLSFRVQGDYPFQLRVSTADPEARRVALRDFNLSATATNDTVSVTLTTTARVRNPKGGKIELLSGGVALTELHEGKGWRMQFENGRFVAVFDQPGDYPLRIQFNAAVRQIDGWSGVDFHVAPAALQPMTVTGLPVDTQFRFPSGARPQQTGEVFRTFVPADGHVQLSWKTARTETEGKLFYSAEMLSQIAISPGLMRQTALLDVKVMQGELTRMSLRVQGTGEVTRVLGENVLAWRVEAVTNSRERRLVIQFNQALRDNAAFQVQAQTVLSAFPLSFDALRLAPEGATRFAGYFRVVNDGAVRVEVGDSRGMTQVAPEQFPESALTQALLKTEARQRFVYRFSDAGYSMRIQADNVLPEISLSYVVGYHLGEAELAIDAELELDIREAPVREVVLTVPKGYALSRLAAANSSDYFITEREADTELRIVYGQPVAGKQVVVLRLERNQPLGAATWALPRIDLPKAKSTRGHVAVSVDPGFRVAVASASDLTEIATAYFPRKINNIQVALRATERAWQATLRVERLPQSVNVDGFHLFSIAERIAYGSSVLNYLVSGAPVTRLSIELSSEYYNVEFLGKEVRNWVKTTNGYEVQLHTPVSGAYTLLASYERPFKGQGETLTFTGARPVDAANEQGHTIVVSAYQFNVKPATVSRSLLPLEPAEVPAEYRLFFDAPILAAYRYTARPFNLELALSPLSQGDTLGQVADRAAIVSRISKEGQVITHGRYFVKNRGQPHFRLTLPAGHELWSVTVNGATAVPTLEGKTHLVPLPQQADPNAVVTVEAKVASTSDSAKRVEIAAPIVGAPVLLADWRVEPDAGQRLEYRKGSLAPTTGVFDHSGFATLFRGVTSRDVSLLGVALGLLICGLLLLRWGSRPGTYRFNVSHAISGALGLLAIVASLLLIAITAANLPRAVLQAGTPIIFLAPVQQAGSALTATVSNLRDDVMTWHYVIRGWPILAGIAAFVSAWFVSRSRRPFLLALGWTMLFWAALRWPHGLPLFLALVIVLVLLHVAVPAFRRFMAVPPRPGGSPAEGASEAGPAVALLIGAMMLAPDSGSAATNAPRRVAGPAVAESVVQQVRVEDKFAFGTVRVNWRAEKGELLPILHEPAVLTSVDFPTNTVRLIASSVNGRQRYELAAISNGPVVVDFTYQVQPVRKDDAVGFNLPTRQGLVSELTLTVAGLDVDVQADNAVSIEYRHRHGELGASAFGSNTVARLVLKPGDDCWVAWRPRSRDTRRERPVFFVELAHLFIPAAGVIEGQHHVQVRPAQGQVQDLVFDVPAGATITDVSDPASTNKSGGVVSVWRFDPDARQLKVTLRPAQSRPFSIIVRSQISAGPLPFERSIGVISPAGAAGQVGMVGVATGSDVQLDNVTADSTEGQQSLSPINIEDFPRSMIQAIEGQFPGLALRRTFRYADSKATATIAASAVQPDIRVESQQTLSLGEDRTLLAVNAAVEVLRAGIFRLSFALPPGLDVESVTGTALNHWTDLKTETNRIVTLHLKGKTEGTQSFSISLAGPGVKGGTNWVVPRFEFREANKQRGQLVIVPEQGLRLTVATRSGATQLDPQKTGIRQKGVLAFRLLQDRWTLALNMEPVDPWVQVSSFEHVAAGEAQLKVTANLQYQIENTGLKLLRVHMPTNAESVRFTGEQVADFLPRAGAITNGLQEWEVKLHRRVIGTYMLQVTYQTTIAPGTRSIKVRGIEAGGVNLQRGFFTAESAGRLRIDTPSIPSALQPSEWQSVPKPLRHDLQAEAANFTFRLVDPSFELTLNLNRQEAARLLPARVNHASLKSVVSDAGVLLTQVRLDMIPGDLRLLAVGLPDQARFWFAFVDQNAVVPWLSGGRIMVPLEQQSRPDQAIVVELFYAHQAGAARSTDLDLRLLGPKFDLPLEDITWQVFLNEKWKVKDWKGTLQLVETGQSYSGGALDLSSYLEKEAVQRSEKTRVAEQQLQLGNTLLNQGAQQQARQAFQNAFGLSQHDMAFNEDARVQLHNVKMQQALVGLSVRQSSIAGQAGALAARLRELRSRTDAAYTPDDAKQLIERNAADDTAALTKLAERMIQQQDAAVAPPVGIRAAIPEQGRILTFKRAVQVDPREDLRIDLEAKVTNAAPAGGRALVLGGLFVAVAAVLRASRRNTARTSK